MLDSGTKIFCLGFRKNPSPIILGKIFYMYRRGVRKPLCIVIVLSNLIGCAIYFFKIIVELESCECNMCYLLTKVTVLRYLLSENRDTTWCTVNSLIKVYKVQSMERGYFFTSRLAYAPLSDLTAMTRRNQILDILTKYNCLISVLVFFQPWTKICVITSCV